MSDGYSGVSDFHGYHNGDAAVVGGQSPRECSTEPGIYVCNQVRFG